MLPTPPPKEWAEGFKHLKGSINTMQEFFLYTNKKYHLNDHIGVIDNGKVKYLSRHEIHLRALSIGAFLWNNGIRVGDRVGVYCEGRPETAIFIEACHLFGFVVVLTFDSSIATYPRFTLQDAGISCLYISPIKATRMKFLFENGFPGLKFVIVNEKNDDCPIESYLVDDIIRTPHLDALPQVNPEMPCTICYSSGTVGAPKGVVLSNQALLYGVFYIILCVPVNQFDVHLSYLPVAHILERIGFLVFQYQGAKIIYASNGFQGAIDDMKMVKTTGGPIIPLVLGKIHNAVMSKFESPLHKNILHFCLSITRFCKYLGFRSRIADHLVFNKVKSALGGEVKWFAVAGDVLDKKVHEELMLMFDIDIIAIYGMSECAGPISATPKRNIVPGTVGHALPEIDLQFGTKNELLIKSPAMFSQYWKNKETTQNSFLNGWLRTGDRGEVDPNSHHLIVTGRAYDMCEFQPGVQLAIPFLRYTYSNYILVTDVFIKPLEEFNALVGIIVVDKKIGAHYTKNPDLSDEDFKNVLNDPNFIEYIKYNTNKYGAETARLNTGSELVAVRLTDEPFTIENNLLTATGKLRIGALTEKYQDEIEQMRVEIRNSSCKD